LPVDNEKNSKKPHPYIVFESVFEAKPPKCEKEATHWGATSSRQRGILNVTTETDLMKLSCEVQEVCITASSSLPARDFGVSGVEFSVSVTKEFVPC
jgi:hypothetical protein